MPTGDDGRTFMETTTKTFVSRASPAVRRVTSVGATISRKIAGTVVRNCRGVGKIMALVYHVRRGVIRVIVVSRNMNVTSVRGTERPLCASGPGRRQDKVNFAIVRAFVSMLVVRSRMKGKAGVAVQGQVKTWVSGDMGRCGLVRETERNSGLTGRRLFRRGVNLVHLTIGEFSKHNCRDRSLFRIKTVKLVGTVSGFSANFGIGFSACTMPVVVKRVGQFVESSKVVGIDHDVGRLSFHTSTIHRTLEGRAKRRPGVDRVTGQLKMASRRITTTFSTATIPSSVCTATSSNDRRNRTLVSHLRDRGGNRGRVISGLLVSSTVGKLSGERRGVVVLQCCENRARDDVTELLKVSRIRMSQVRGEILTRVGRGLSRGWKFSRDA